MKKRRFAIVIAAAAVLGLSAEAATAAGALRDGLTSITVETITCPAMVNGVHIDRLHQFSAPNGWADSSYPGGGYSNASLRVNRHWLSDNNHTLNCGYGANSGNIDFVLVHIARSAPARRNCAKAANYSFRCTLPRLRAPK